MNPQLVWKSNRFPRINSIGQKYEIRTLDNIDIIARVVCKREMKEATGRIRNFRGQIGYCPSANWTKTRLTFRTPKNHNNGNNNSTRPTYF